MNDTNTADFQITSTRFHRNFPRSLCQTLAKQFLTKDSWHPVLGILEQLHSDDDERPLDPSASSWETPAGLNACTIKEEH